MSVVLDALGIIIGFLLAVGLLIVVLFMISVLIDWARIILLDLKIKRITKKIDMNVKNHKVMSHEKD